MDDLIKRVNNYKLDRKILSIDSNGRDLSKWPNSSEFEVQCPQRYTNVESIKLLDIQLPNKIYNISEELQNNKINYTISGTLDVSAVYSSGMLVLPDGYYDSGDVLADAFSFSMKKNIIHDNSFIDFTTYDSSNVFFAKFDDITNKIIFGSRDLSFSFSFENIIYNNCINNINNNYSTNNNVIKFNNALDWGLGAILGFSTYNKYNTVYSNMSDASYSNYFSDGTNIFDISSSTSFNIITPEMPVILHINPYIYLEIYKFNSCDEVSHSSEKTIKVVSKNIRSSYSNLSSTVNGFFAKIPIIRKDTNQSITGHGNFSESLSVFEPPLQEISKFKFKFRYDDKLLVNFKNYTVSLTLEVNQLRDTMRSYDARKPHLINQN
jgi:hypothetical protein